jgi:hypothetical protein
LVQSATAMDTHLPDDTLMAPRFLFDAIEVGPEI